MSYKVSDIAYESKSKLFWVLKIPTGYEVYQVTGTHSTRCAQIGYVGEQGLQKAIIECDRREKLYWDKVESGKCASK